MPLFTGAIGEVKSSYGKQHVQVDELVSSIVLINILTKVIVSFVKYLQIFFAPYTFSSGSSLWRVNQNNYFTQNNKLLAVISKVFRLIHGALNVYDLYNYNTLQCSPTWHFFLSCKSKTDEQNKMRMRPHIGGTHNKSSLHKQTRYKENSFRVLLQFWKFC